MGESDRMRLEAALGRHYSGHHQRVAVDHVDRLVELMLAEDSRVERAGVHELGTLGFVCAQVRFVPGWVWAAQLCIVVGMVWVALACGDIPPVRWAVGAMSAASVLVCVPTLLSGKRHKVVELEYPCRFNAVRVLAARLLILGCSCALAVATMVVGTSAATGLGALAVALWACPPYFGSCAATLAAQRRLRPESAAMASVAWVAAVCSALLIASEVFPGAYGLASLAVWGLAAAAAFTWLVREALLVLRSAAAGLDSWAPYLSRTYA